MRASYAQESAEGETWSVTIGAGGLTAPSYEGDDSYRLSILPDVQVKFGDTFFASAQEGVGYRMINETGLRAAPIGRIKFSRDEDGDQPFAVTGEDSNDLRGLGDVDTSIELGGFVAYDVGPIMLGAEARKAVSGHNGFVADLEANWAGRSNVFGAPLMWSLGPGARIVDGDYNQTFFGITAEQAMPSGLPARDADGGIQSLGFGASAIIPLDERWVAVGFAGYDRLLGDAANSPLVQLRGSEDQASVGVFVSYRAF